MANMTALQKRDGGVGGIATGTSFRRLVATTLARVSSAPKWKQLAHHSSSPSPPTQEWIALATQCRQRQKLTR